MEKVTQYNYPGWCRLSNKGQYTFCLACGSAYASTMEATGLQKPRCVERPWANALVSNPNLHDMCSSEWMSLLIIPATRHWITLAFEFSSWGSKRHDTESLPFCVFSEFLTQRIWTYKNDCFKPLGLGITCYVAIAARTGLSGVFWLGKWYNCICILRGPSWLWRSDYSKAKVNMGRQGRKLLSLHRIEVMVACVVWYWYKREDMKRQDLQVNQ